LHGGRKADDRPRGAAHFCWGARLKHRHTPAALADRVLERARNDTTHEFMGSSCGFEARMLTSDIGQNAADQWDRRNIIEAEEVRAQTVVDVMRVIGDVVR